MNSALWDEYWVVIVCPIGVWDFLKATVLLNTLPCGEHASYWCIFLRTIIKNILLTLLLLGDLPHRILCCTRSEKGNQCYIATQIHATKQSQDWMLLSCFADPTSPIHCSCNTARATQQHKVIKHSALHTVPCNSKTSGVLTLRKLFGSSYCHCSCLLTLLKSSIFVFFLNCFLIILTK